MERFADHAPFVRNLSECIVSPDGVEDQITGTKRGVKCEARYIRWVLNSEFEVTGSVFANGCDGTGYVYRVTLDEGRWAVKESRVVWILC